MPLCNKCTTNAVSLSITNHLSVTPHHSLTHTSQTLPLRPVGSKYYDNMESYASRLQDNCHAEDPLCCTTGTNGLAHLSYFNLETSNAAVQFVKQKYAEIAGSSASAYAATVTVSSAKSCVSIFGNNTPSTTGAGATTTGGPSPTSTGTGAASSGASRTSSTAPASATGGACRAVVAGQAVGALAAALCAGSLLM